MGRIEKTVFLSYRRTNASWALAVFQDLSHNGYDVFFDFDGLASGDFERNILESIRARAHFIVLLTPSALQRCDEPGDWLRREIETALDCDRNIVPLMFEGFSFSTPEIDARLSGKLASLKKLNALSVPTDYFESAMHRLRDKFLNVPLDAVLHPVSSATQAAATAQQVGASAAPPVAENDLTAEQWFERGVLATDPDEKIRFYSQAVRLKSTYAVAFNNRGVARDEKGDSEGAAQDYDVAIRLDPDAIMFKNRGRLRWDQSDWSGAVNDFDEAVRLKPDDAESIYFRGRARQKTGDLHGALSDLDEAIRLRRDDSEVFNSRGRAREDLGDVDGALEDYEEALRRNPGSDANSAVVLYNRGALRRAKGDIIRALEDFEEAIRLNPGMTIAVNARAEMMRNPKLAIKGLRGE